MYPRDVFQTQFIIGSAPSRAYFIVVLHALALLALIVAQVSLLWRSLLLCAVGISGYWHWKAQWLPISLFYHNDTGWGLTQSSDVRAIVIQSSTVVTSLFCVIHYSEGANSKVHTLLCFRDSMPRKDYKMLMVLLKITPISKGALQ